ncbi:MAG: hypothetical protein V3S55_09925 [Nitrospiraceae bacterium]
MSRNFGDIVQRISNGYGIPTAEAQRLLGRPTFIIKLDDLSDEEASDVFVSRFAQGQATKTAVALEFGHVQLFNPDASGVLAKISGVLVSSDTNLEFTVRGGVAAIGATAGNQAFADRRINGSTPLQIRTEGNAVLQGSPTIGRANVLASGATFVPLSWILPENEGIIIAASSVDVVLTATYFWQEETSRV